MRKIYSLLLLVAMLLPSFAVAQNKAISKTYKSYYNNKKKETRILVPFEAAGFDSKQEVEQVSDPQNYSVGIWFKATDIASNPGSAFGIAINKGDTKTIIDAMIEKGIGLYTFWISKDNADLPAAVKEKNSSCRGLCCVDTVKETGWYGWIQLFDHDGYMYTRYIRNSVPTEWRSC